MTDYKKLLAETAKRFSVAINFDVEKNTFPKQAEFINSTSRYNVAKCSRRAGKTEALMIKHYKILKKYAGVNTLYVGLNRKTAKNIFWERFKLFLTKIGERFEENNTELTIKLSNGSMFFLMGCATERDVDKARGMRFKYISLDEIQSYPPFVRRLIREVFRPTLIDWKGGMDLTGTPNPSCAGVFRDAWDDNKKSGMGGYKQFEWTLHDNKFLYGPNGYANADEVIKEELELTGLTLEDPVIQRELFGRWVKDNDAAVYKYLPMINDWEDEELPSNYAWSYVMGVDLGFRDADAVVVLAFCEDLPYVFVVEEFKQSNQDITDLAIKLKEIFSRYGGEENFVAKVADYGGNGTKIIEELRNRHGINFDNAEKNQKWGYIRLMNDDFRKAHIKVLKNKVPLLIHEWENLDKVTAYKQENPLKEKEDERYPNHLADACLYAWREAYHYTYKEKPKRAPYGTPEHYEEEADKYFEQTLQEIQNAKDNNDDDWGNW